MLELVSEVTVILVKLANYKFYWRRADLPMYNMGMLCSMHPPHHCFWWQWRQSIGAQCTIPPHTCINTSFLLPCVLFLFLLLLLPADLRVNFSRSPVDECNLQCSECEVVLEPWPQPEMEHSTTINARIGQSGSERGYAGITGSITCKSMLAGLIRHIKSLPSLA